MSTYACAVCTFENNVSRPRCEICDAPRGSVTAPAASLAAQVVAAPRPLPPVISSSVAAPAPPPAIYYGLVYRPLSRRRPSIPIFPHGDIPLPLPVITEPEISDPNFYPVPLESVNITSIVHDFATQVTVEQNYNNSEDTVIETKYVFPLPDGAAVAKFEATFDGQTIRGVIREKESAKKEYEAAVREKKQAVLVEQERPDTFICTIGNIKPGQRCTIRLTYVSEMKIDNGKARYTLPSVCAPPFVPRPKTFDAASSSSSSPSLPSAVTAPRATAAITPYRLAISIDISQPSSITSLTSPSHRLAIDRRSDTRSIVTLSDGSMTMDRDFVLIIEQSTPYGSRAVVEQFEDVEGKTGFGGKGLAIQVTFCERTIDIKDVMAADLYCEVIFLLDISGSMAGSAMDNAKNTVQLFLRSLPERARFNIIAFESNYRTLFAGGSRAYDDDTLGEATAWVAALKATGGTEILAPLQSLFRLAPVEGYPRNILLLTDGQVSNTDAILSLVKANAERARIFTLGIGSSVDHHLVSSVARAGGGHAEFVVRNDLIADKVSAQLARILQPAIDKVTVDFGQGYTMTADEPGSTTSEPVAAITTSAASKPLVTNAMIRQSPAKLPPIYPGTRYFVYGLVDGDKLSFADKFDVKVSVHYTNGTTSVISIPVTSSSPNSRRGTLIHKLAARSRIKELELDGSSNPMVKGECLYLGLKYGILSNYTSFVAISDRIETDIKDGEPTKREVVLSSTGDDDNHRGDAATGPRDWAIGMAAAGEGAAASGAVMMDPFADVARKRGRATGAVGGGGGGGGRGGSRGGSAARLGRRGSFGAAPIPSAAPGGASDARNGHARDAGDLMASLNSQLMRRSAIISDADDNDDGSWDEEELSVPERHSVTTMKDSSALDMDDFFAASPAPMMAPLAPSSSSSSSSSSLFGESLPAAPAARAQVAMFDMPSSPVSSHAFGFGGPPPPPAAPPAAAAPPMMMAQQQARWSSSPRQPSSGVQLERESSRQSLTTALSSSLRMKSVATSSTTSSVATGVAVSEIKDPFQRLIQSQKVDGSWLLDRVINVASLSYTHDVASTIFTGIWTAWISGVRTSHADIDIKEDASVMASESNGLIGTLMALSILTSRFASKSSEWLILSQKSRSWILKRFQRIFNCHGGVVDWSTHIDALITPLGAIAA